MTMDLLLTLIGNYYGIDWLALFFMSVSVILLGSKNRWGFLVGMCSNVCWVIFGIIAGSLADPLANIIVFSLNVRGYMHWRPV